MAQTTLQVPRAEALPSPKLDVILCTIEILLITIDEWERGAALLPGPTRPPDVRASLTKLRIGCESNDRINKDVSE